METMCALYFCMDIMEDIMGHRVGSCTHRWRVTRDHREHPFIPKKSDN